MSTTIPPPTSTTAAAQSDTTANDARLAHARKLLSKFQSRQRNVGEMIDVEVVVGPSPTTNAPTTNTSPHQSNPVQTVAPLRPPSVDANVAQSVNGGSSHPPSIGTPSMEQTPHSSRSSSFVNIDQSTGIPHDPNLNGVQSPHLSEVYALRQALTEKDHHLNSTLTKLQALHGHYADLHQAYAELRAKQTNSATAEFSQQISQLQTALAIAVSEKTQLQSELRNAGGHQKALEAELEFLRQQAKGVINDAQSMAQQAEIQQLNAKIANQSTVIANQRKECAELEAKIVVLNQDRNDFQARLKFVYQEKDELAAQLHQLKNELNIKEIYIRQLAKHSSADSTQGQQTIQSLTEQKNFFEAECQRYSNELVALRNEFDASRRNFEECLAQSRAHSATLEQTIEQMTNQKRQLEFSKCCLEEELQLLRKNAQDALERAHAQKADASSTQGPSAIGTHNNEQHISVDDYEALKNSYQRLEVEFQRQTVLIGQLNSALEEKDSTIDRLNNHIGESDHRISTLEGQIRSLQQMGTDVSQLSAQLQNERATVSRAVSQNMELKEQLGELQDKLVQLTNDYAQSEEQRSSALATVNKLSRQLEEMGSAHPRPPSTSVDVQTDSTIASEEPSRQSPDDAPPHSTERASLIAPPTHEHQHQQDSDRIKRLQFSPVVTVHYPDQADHHRDTHVDQPSSHSPVDDHHQQQSVAISNSTGTFDETATSTGGHDSRETSTSASPESSSQPPTSSDHHQRRDETSDSDDQEQSSEEEDTIADFIYNPRPTDTDFARQLRSAFQHLQENAKSLQGRVEMLERLNVEYRNANDRLQYWLTAVESENESIGDFIELYRAQRAQIQSKVIEKEKECEKLKQDRDLMEKRVHLLRTSFLDFLKKSQPAAHEEQPPQENAGDNASQPGNVTAEKCTVHELIRLFGEMKDENVASDSLQQLTRALQNSSITFDSTLHCSECRGKMYDL